MRLPPREVLRWMLRVARQTARRWVADRCSQEAASLAFKTALAIVPLTAIAFSLLKVVGKLQERGAFIEFFADTLFPAVDARSQVSAAVLGFADNIATEAVGGVGLVVLIVVVFLLWHEIEGFFNRVWSAPKPRSLLSKFFVFYTLMTLVPFLSAVSLYHTARFWRGGPVGYLAPLGSTFAAFLLANKMIPAVPVRWVYAWLGASVSAVLFELAKFGFSRYAAVAVGKYNSVYGALGLVPLVLLWILVAWLTVLLGAEVAHAAQELRSLEAGERRRRGDVDETGWELVNGPAAARLMLELSRAFTVGEAAPGAPELAERLALPEVAVLQLVRRLQERGLIRTMSGDGAEAGDGFIPARPPSVIRLNQVLAAFRIGDPTADGNDPLARLFGELDRASYDRGEITFDQLLVAPPAIALVEEGK